MTARRILIPLISIIGLAASCLAAEPFKIPKEHAKAMVGSWKLVAVGQGADRKAVPPGKAMTFIFRADGSGIQRKGEREQPIVWGADREGAFAFQWKQEGGKGDGLMGTWKETEEGIELNAQEYDTQLDDVADFLVAEQDS